MRILLAATLFASACAAQTGAPPADQQLDLHSGGKADGESCDQFDSESADTYLGNFLYKATDDGWYRMAFTYDSASLPNGDKATITAYLLADNRAVVDYQEEHRIDETESDVKNQTVVVTHYSVDPTTRALTINGIGGGAPLTIARNGGCAAAYAFTFSDDVRTPGLAGQATSLDAGRTSGVLVDPDHLDQAPEGARQYFEDQVADGDVVVIHK